MPSFSLTDAVLDNGLAAFALVNKIVICSAEPTTYAQANSYALGYKTFEVGYAFGPPTNIVGGRKITSAAVTNGVVTTTGTPVCWAALDDANSRLLVVGSITGAGVVKAGTKFRLASFTVVLLHGEAPVVLLANNLVISSPSPLIGPGIGQKHVLKATNLVPTARAFGAPILRQKHTLVATSLAPSSPVLGTPSVDHILIAESYSTPSPYLLQVPEFYAGSAYELTALSLETSSPVFGEPVIDGLNVQELFGISHPEQILTFANLTLNPATQKLMTGGSEVPYQVDGSNVLVRLNGGISANGSKSWGVEAGARSAPSEVSVTDGGTYYQIDNTLIAVRTPKTITVGTPSIIPDNPDPPEKWMRIATSSAVLAPIQGIRHRDGTWTGTGPNYLYNDGWHDGWLSGRYNFPATSATVEIIENGPLRAKIKITMSAVRPAYPVSGTDFDGPTASYASVSPYDDGYFICTITVEAGQAVIIVDQETDMHPSWYVDMDTGVDADRGRFRSHAGLGIDALQGHNYDGTPYTTQDIRGDADGECNLPESYRAGQYGELGQGVDWTGGAFDGVIYAPLALWYDWTRDQGWYWFNYSSTGGANSNIWGIFEGRASLVLGGSSMSYGVGTYGKPLISSPPRTEYGFATWPRARGRIDPPDHSVEPRRFTFGIYLGSKGADVPVDFSTVVYAPYGAYAPSPTINKIYNLHSGTASFWKQIGQGVDFPDPPDGFPGMFLNRTDTEAMIADMESDQSEGSLYKHLYDNDANYRTIYNAFAYEYYQSDLVDGIITDIVNQMDNYINWGNIHSIWYAFWQGATKTQSIATRCSAAISLDQYRPFLTAEQKRKVKAALSMAGHILWDNDFVPIDNYESFSLGTANMPIQFGQARSQVAILLKDHPQFSARFAGVLSDITYTFTAAVNAYGAPRDCPHYSGAMTIPTTDILRQLQVAGYTDMFAPGSSLHDRLVGLSEYYMQILTPPQSRFLGERKMVAYGDGAAEGHDAFLSLIMGLEAHDLTLCKRMVGAWDSMGRWLSSFYASSGMKIRHSFPSQDPALGDADFPGSITVMRSGWGTANESAVFLLHGDDNVDHSTFQRGSPSIFLLGAPVCTSFGAMYSMSPKVDGPWTGCSTYIPVSEIGVGMSPAVTWDTGVYYTQCGVHSDYFGDTYVYNPTTNRVDLTCTFEVSGWVRKLTYYRDVVSQPIVRLRDSDTASGDSVFTLHMMATGAVTKPDGSTVTPSTFNATPFNISNGGCFKFTGQWGVSWDVYYFGPAAQAFIGFFSHTWAPGKEAGQYYQATGQSFEEKQYILRIKTAGPCDVVIVPYLTGQRPANLNVVETGGGDLRVDPAARVLLN